MKRPKNTKAILCVLMSFISAGFFASLPNGKAFAKTNQEETIEVINKPLAKLTGFQPLAKVTYDIEAAGQKIFSADSQINQKGDLEISWTPPENLNPVQIVFTFKIFETDGEIKLSLKGDKSGNLQSVWGVTNNEFTEVSIEASGQTIGTKTDWAGLFEETDLYKGAVHNAEEPVRVAFLGTGTMGSLKDINNPSQIEIFYAAPLGGGPGPLGVNLYNPSFCGRDQDISYCDRSRTDRANRNLVDNLVAPLQIMTEQLVNAMASVTGQVGRFIDAKEQLEVMRDHAQLEAQAHKDYHPSDDQLGHMCRYGTFIRTLANTDDKAKTDMLALSKTLDDLYVNKSNSPTYAADVSYNKARLQQYREVYCDPMDHNGGLFLLCEHDQDEDYAGRIGAADHIRKNKDIDYARTMDFPLTLDVDFKDTVVTADEEDMITLSRNLYWTDAMRAIPEKAASLDPKDYFNARQLLSLNNLAHSSYVRLAGKKAAARQPAGGNTDPGWAHMKTMMREFGMPDDEIDRILGERPSYFAQMGVLTKFIYQNPDFYTNLYDKPANVDRIMASMEAISLIQQRDFYESLLRREMLASGMIAEAMNPKIQRIRGVIEDLRPPE